MYVRVRVQCVCVSPESICISVWVDVCVWVRVCIQEGNKGKAYFVEVTAVVVSAE